MQYDLTDLGWTLIEPLAALRAWSETHKNDVLRSQDAYDERADALALASESV